MNLKLMGAGSFLPVVLGLAANVVRGPSPSGGAVEATAAAVVTRSSVLRSGPTTGSAPIGQLAKGAIVSVLGFRHSTGFAQVETEDDEVGWTPELSLHPVDAGSPSATATQNQAHIGPSDIYPDAGRTPGVTNPNITQANINQTICNPDRSQWSTKMIRPSVSYTNPLKTKQIREYGYADTNLRDYEEDHLISLELGGSPTDSGNLWPEPYKTSVPDGGARYKDKVENYLHDQVCAGTLTLAAAQAKIVEDWYQVYTDALSH